MSTSLRTRTARLAMSPRAYWALAGLPNPDSIGNHAYRTALIAICLALTEDGMCLELEANAALRRALDVAEAGDRSLDSFRIPSIERIIGRATPARPTNSASSPNPQLAEIAEKVETVLQALEYERRGDSALVEIPSIPIKTHSAQIASPVLNYIAALAGAIQFEWSPAAMIADFYEAPDYYHQMLIFSTLHGNIRCELLDLCTREALLTVGRHIDVSDVGCGVANLGYSLASRAPSATLSRIDVNKDVLRAIPTGRLGNLSVRNYLTDFSRRWPIASGTQDVVILGEVLEHSFNPNWLLQEANRVLRADGKLVLTVPNAWHWRKILRFLIFHRLERTLASDHIRYFSEKTLKHALMENGFTLERFINFSLKWRHGNSLTGRLQRFYSRLPTCGDNFLAVASREASTPAGAASASDESAALVDFFTAANRAKRMQYSLHNSLSVAEVSFLTAMLAQHVGMRFSLDQDRIVFASLIRGLIEGQIAEYSVDIRLQLTVQDLLQIFEQALRPLPQRYASALAASAQSVSASPEWKLVNELFRAEYFAGDNPKTSTAPPDQMMHDVAALYQ